MCVGLLFQLLGTIPFSSSLSPFPFLSRRRRNSWSDDLSTCVVKYFTKPISVTAAIVCFASQHRFRPRHNREGNKRPRVIEMDSIVAIAPGVYFHGGQDLPPLRIRIIFKGPKGREDGIPVLLGQVKLRRMPLGFFKDEKYPDARNLVATRQCVDRKEYHPACK